MGILKFRLKASDSSISPASIALFYRILLQLKLQLGSFKAHHQSNHMYEPAVP